MTKDKVVDKVVKLRKHMESATSIKSDEEAHAFATMMQRLMLEHSIHEHEIEAAMDKDNKPAPIIEYIVPMEKYGVKVKKRRCAWSETIAHLVGKAHLCKFLVRKNCNQIWFVGTENHTEVAGYVWCHLTKAIEHMSKTAELKERTRCRHIGLGQGGANGYRAAWINSFTTRLAERYEQEKDSIVKEQDAHRVEGGYVPTEGEESLSLIALTGALKRVEAYMDERFRGRGRQASALTGRSTKLDKPGSRTGMRDGRTAANNIALTPRKALTA